MISVADARKARDAAEADVQKKTAARAEALAAASEARVQMEEANARRNEAKAVVDDLKAKLRSIREESVNNTAAARKAKVEYEVAERQVDEAVAAAKAAHDKLASAESAHEGAERALAEANERVARVGDDESAMRTSLDEKVQAATEAQRRLDSASQATADARGLVERLRKELDEADRKSVV